MTVLEAGLALFSYLCGSIPFGLLLTKAFAGKDVRAAGSGNIGATNVMRVAGKKLGAAVLLLDAVKGMVPVFVARQLFPESLEWTAAAGLLAVLGHIFPVWLRFKGGKGVATALGALLATVPLAALAGALTFIVVVKLTRVSAVGSLTGALVGVAVTFATAPRLYAYLNLGILLLMVFTHRGNLSRLVRRTESRF